jgi:hypothetical protein
MYTEDLAGNLIPAPVSAVPKAPVERKVAIPRITDEMI